MVLSDISNKERQSARGGRISPTITCNPENIYVYEGIQDVSVSERRQ